MKQWFDRIGKKLYETLFPKSAAWGKFTPEQRCRVKAMMLGAGAGLRPDADGVIRIEHLDANDEDDETCSGHPPDHIKETKSEPANFTFPQQPIG